MPANIFFFMTARASFLFFFFFQAEDGIRAFHVTGVQTCALPISRPPVREQLAVACDPALHAGGEVPDTDGLPAPVLRGYELLDLLLVLDLRARADPLRPDRLELLGVDLLDRGGVHSGSRAEVWHHEQPLDLPVELAEARFNCRSELVVDRDLAVSDAGRGMNGLGLLGQLVRRHFGAEVDGEMVEVEDARQARRQQPAPVRRRDDFLDEPFAEGALELDRARELAHRRGPSSIESSAMSRRKKSDTVQSATTRSFLDRSGSWYRWYVRVIHQPAKPRIGIPETSAIPR